MNEQGAGVCERPRLHRIELADLDEEALLRDNIRSAYPPVILCSIRQTCSSLPSQTRHMPHPRPPKTGDLRPHLIDESRILVPHRGGQCPVRRQREFVTSDVHVGAADVRRRNADHDLRARRLGFGDLFDDEGSSGAMEACGAYVSVPHNPIDCGSTAGWRGSPGAVTAARLGESRQRRDPGQPDANWQKGKQTLGRWHLANASL